MFFLIAATALLVIVVAVARTFAEAHQDDRCVIRTLRRIDAPTEYITCSDTAQSKQ